MLSLERLHISELFYIPEGLIGLTSLVSRIAPRLAYLRLSIAQYHRLMVIHTELQTALGESPSPSARLPPTIQKVIIEYPPAPLEVWHPLFQHPPTSEGYKDLVTGLKNLAVKDDRFTMLEPLEKSSHHRAEKESRRAEGQWLDRNEGGYGCWL